MHSFTYSISRTKQSLLSWRRMGISHIEGEIKNIEKETLSMEEMSLSSDEIWRYTWLRPLQNRHNALLRQKKTTYWAKGAKK